MDGKELSGRIIPISSKQLRARMKAVFKEANVKRVGNGITEAIIKSSDILKQEWEITV